MRLRFIVSVALCSTLWTALQAQQTAIYTEANAAYKKGIDFYDKGIYNLAMQEFQVALEQLRPVPEPEARLLRGSAELYYAKAAVRAGQPNGERLMVEYIRNYTPDPLAGQAAIEMGDYYFNQGKADKALVYYEAIEASLLPPAQRNMLYYKKGYAFFVKKNFAQAKASFSRIINDESNVYYNEANYYYGMCVFSENNLEEAARSFARIKNSKQYSAVVPYYLTQIYAVQRDYDRVISTGLDALDDNNIKNAREINTLVGQAYFEKKDYIKAEKYLSEGLSPSNVRAEDYYQLGFCQHKNGHFKEAIATLENLSGVNSKLGQHGMYLLGDAYLRLGDRQKAVSPFSTASRMDYDLSIQEEALWNYAKLTYELKQVQLCTEALQAVRQGSKYYNEAQSLLSEVLLNSGDYETALRIINNAPVKTPKLRESAQKAMVYRALQKYNEGDLMGAQRLLLQSLTDAPDATAKAMANYWVGEIYHQQKEYDQSQRYLTTFLTLAQTVNNLPAESSVYMANYMQGYNAFKKKDFEKALPYFDECVRGIKRNEAYISNDLVRTKILSDATVRLGDCQLSRNKYAEAIRYYDEVITRNQSGFVYALYSKAIAQGIMGRQTDKIINLEKLVNNYPQSEYAPAALFDLGMTNQNDLKNWSEAEKNYKRLLQNYKSDNDLTCRTLLQLGLLAQNKGNVEESISYYKQVFSNNPTPNQAKSALEFLEDIYVNDKNDPDSYFSFLNTIPNYKMGNYEQDSLTYRAAEALFEKQNYDAAIQSFTSYLNKYPNSLNTLSAYSYRADCYLIKKDSAAALSDYESILVRGTSAYYLKSVENAAILAYTFKKDYAKALDYFGRWEKSAVKEDDRFDAQLGGMRSAERLKRNDQVYEFANKIANNAQASAIQKDEANLFIIRTAMAANDFTKAQNSLNFFSKKPINNAFIAEARYLDALIEYKKRNLNAALDKSDAASAGHAYNYWIAKCLLLQADIFAEQGNLLDARAALEAIISAKQLQGFPELIDEAKQKLNNVKAKEEKKSNLNADPKKNNLLDMDGNR